MALDPREDPEFANRMFEHVSRTATADNQLAEQLARIFGGPLASNPYKEFPFNNWFLDDYDGSIEFLGAETGWRPTKEQLHELQNLGFDLMYVRHRPDESGLCVDETYSVRGLRKWARSSNDTREYKEISESISSQELARLRSLLERSRDHMRAHHPPLCEMRLLGSRDHQFCDCGLEKLVDEIERALRQKPQRIRR